MVRTILKLVTNTLWILCLLVSSPALANIGSITEAKGAGQVKRGTAAIPAGRGTGIEKMDTVSTNSQGRFKITFVDTTTVNITENSRLVIDAFVFDNSNKSSGRLGLKVALGTVRYASGALAHGNPGGVNIRTPTATIAVRGTDFVMSVDEIGKTTVVLLPSCYDDKDPTKITDNCPTGAIDVITAAGIVKMTQPFQATMVENNFTPPSPPVKINLSLRQLNNSLQVSSPQTFSGISLAKISSDSQKQSLNPSKVASDSNKNPSVSVSTQATDASSNSTDSSAGIDASLETVSVAVAMSMTASTVIIPQSNQMTEVTNTATIPVPIIHTNVSPVYDKKSTQIGWAYSTISEDKQQASTVTVPTNSQVQVIVTQNGITDSYNFANQKYPVTGDGKAQGIISINQRGPQ